MRNFRLFRPAIFSFCLSAALLALLGLCRVSLLTPQDRGPEARSAARPAPEIFLESFFRSRDIYEAAFAAAGAVPKVGIRAGVVSHHFLARDLIARFFAGIDPRGVRRVILLAPDHYLRAAGRGPLFFSSLLTWRTPDGMMAPDEPFIRELLASGDGALDDGLFRQEHGIYVLVPFIKMTFPRASLVPLVLPPGSDYPRFYRLGQRLSRSAPGGTVLIVSSDFAHEVNRAQARRLDRESISLLRTLYLPQIEKIHADCRPGLATLAGFRGSGARDFILVDHKTSADFGSVKPGNLTSYVAAYYREAAPQTTDLLFLGDLMVDRHIRELTQEKGVDYIFRKISPLLKSAALVVANLEGPITGNPSVSLGSRPQERNHYTFTFPPGLAAALKEHHITLVHLGNNHILDFGPQGLEQTRKYLGAAGVDYFGEPGRRNRRWLFKDLDGMRLAFVSFNQFAPHCVEQTLSDLQEARPLADLVILSAHWGREYLAAPGARLSRWAHLFIDQGADLIIGSHSHTVQPKEEYRGKRIYYSLGNFIFDQYGKPETNRGLAVKVKIDPRTRRTAFTEIPLSLENNGQTIMKSQ